MHTPLRLLLVEDSEQDAKMLIRAVRHGGYDVAAERVETAEELSAALQRQDWDVLLADYTLPSLNGLAVLELLRQRGSDLPVIIVSGSIGEEGAVECIKRGAADYLFKDRLGRLGQAIQRVQDDRRLRAEHRSSEARYRTLVETSPDAIVVTDLQATILMANQRAAELYHVAGPEALVGLAAVELVVADERPRALEDLRAAGEAGRISNRVFTARRPDGTTCPIELSAALLRAADGRTDGVMIVARDISARKQAEEAIRFQAHLLDTVGEAVSATDLRLTIIYWNRAAEALYGWAAEEAVGRRFDEVMQTPDDQEAAEAIRVSLHAGQRWTGQLLHRRRDGGTFPALVTVAPVFDERGTVIGGVGVSADITAQKNAEETLRTRSRQQAAAAELGQRALAGGDLDALLDATVALMAETLNVECCSVLELLPDGDAFLLRAGTGWRMSVAGETRLDAGRDAMGGYVLLSDGPVIAEDLGAEPRFRSPQLLAEGVVAGMSVIIRGNAGAFGTLGAFARRRRTFSDDDVSFLQALANVLAQAIQRKQAEQQIRRQLERLSALRAIDLAIATSLDLRVTLGLFLEQVRSTLAVDAAAVLLLDPLLLTLEYAEGRGFRGQAIARSRLRLGEGLAGRAALERRPVRVPDLAASGEGFLRAQVLQEEELAAYFALPLLAKGQVQGVLELLHRTPLAPDPDWLDFAAALASQAALAVDNARLFQNLQRSNTELALAYDRTIEGWSRALDLRDKETEGHSRRVTELTLTLARQMGLGEAELVHVRRGALLHDIGKMGIPDAILLKPGKLTQEEWEVMRRHPTYAYELLAQIAYLRQALDIPHCHHERWDGSGYPRGLKGGQIPLAARIFAVADVHDALTSDRPYRPAWSVAQAREHIAALAGSHFDPAVVGAFLSLKESP